ncbi:MAG: choice-of-anchor L domain-containing protein [Bacteroidota bacterium]
MRFLRILKKIFAIGMVSILAAPFILKAQLITSTTLTPAQLVQNVLLGAGVTASNITYTGLTITRGSFDGASSNIGFSSGVILSCGDIANAEGPNNDDATSQSNGFLGDNDLDSIMSPTLSYDVSILEFDFIPTSDTIKFRYVFGSDEYMEYVSPFPGGINDGFGFFISGPGITGPFSGNAKNIALIPGTSLPVTMYNLNLNNNGTYYFDNGDGYGSGTAPDGLTIQYDGFTVPLTAICPVQCGQTYHIKIAIGDGGDEIIDSGVFLEAGSFSSSGNISISTSANNFGGIVPGNDSTIYEGCGFASIVFDRGPANSTNPDTLSYSISGTANNGLDYSTILNTIYFAPGQDTALLTINSLPDGLTEGIETIILSIYQTSTCGATDTLFLTIYIVDTPPLQVKLPNDTSFMCPVQNLSLTATVTGGVIFGGHTYTWTNVSGNGATVFVSPTTTTTYYVTATDSCGQTATDSIRVNIMPYASMQLLFNNDTSICSGNSVFLHATVSSGSPGYTYFWSPAVSTTDTVTVTTPTSATYTITVRDACGMSVSDQVTINVNSILADFNYDITTDQTVQFTDMSTGAVSYFWNFGDGSVDSTSILKNPSHYYGNPGSYTVMLTNTNAEGCSDTTYKTLTILPEFHFYFPNAFTPNGDDHNSFFRGYGVGIRSYRMRIFDRWGEVIFDTSDINKGWDGTYGGKILPSAVYVCVFDVQRMDYKKIRRIESVTLVR